MRPMLASLCIVLPFFIGTPGPLPALLLNALQISASSDSVPYGGAAQTSPHFSGAAPAPRTDSADKSSLPTLLVVVVAAILGGLSGAIAAHLLDVREATRTLRRATLRNIVGSRHEVTGPAFSTALNEAVVVYGDSREVIAAIETLVKGPDNDRLYELYTQMAKAAGVTAVTKGLFVTAFNVRKPDN